MKFNLQLFADESQTEETVDSSTLQTDDVTSTNTEQEGTPQEETTSDEKDTAKDEKEEKADYSKLGSMNITEQLEYLKKFGVIGGKEQEKPKEEVGQEEKKEEEKPKEKTEEKKQPEPNPDDKTAQLQKQIDAMYLALQAQQAEKQKNQPRDKPIDIVSKEYEAATAEVERELGLKPGEYNPYEPKHSFALQKVLARVDAMRAERQAINAEIQEFSAKESKDPMGKEINDKFDQYLFLLGGESPEGGIRVNNILMAKQRFFSGMATKADVKLLKEHWEYVRGKLNEAKGENNTAIVKKKHPEPPKTEAPSDGKDSTPKYKMDYEKFGKANPRTQLEMLKKAGYIH